MQNKNKYQVPALMRAARILELLGKKSADLTEIMTILELPKSSAYSLVLTLEELGFVRRLADGHRFTLGFRLFELGNLSVTKVSIRDYAMRHIQELVQREKVTSHLGALDGAEAVYLLKVDPQDSILINSWEGKRVALTRSAMGKVLLAWLPQERQIALLKSASFVKKTPKTIVDMDELRNHLADVKRQGWAIDDEEDILGIRCVGAPVFSPDGAVRYALSISSTVLAISPERIPELVKAVTEAANNISRSIGTPPEMFQR
jgi:DNA-binding IclR family transcriptional regulator